ncbi:MAG: hypothetical protein JSS68_14130 [Actinobacteria bacterium]|nr:hypothetical protein [Actinomycetota bacterium]MBS1884333.1 hypothetical protein [Actinomycetota bacterium]
MTTLGATAVVLGAIWLGALTVAVILMVRQIGLLTIRLTYSAPHGAAEEHGPAIGHPVPDRVMELLSLNGEGRNLVFLSCTCTPCRDFASRVTSAELGSDTTIAISGREELARGVAALLPEGADSVFDPVSDELAHAFGIQMVPFALHLAEGHVKSKTYLRSPQDLGALRNTDNGGNGRVIALDVEAGGD